MKDNIKDKMITKTFKKNKSIFLTDLTEDLTSIKQLKDKKYFDILSQNCSHKFKLYIK